MKKLTRYIILVVMILVITSCFLPMRGLVFDIVASNTGRVLLDKVTIEFPEFWDRPGVLSPGGGASSRYSNYGSHRRLPWPQTAKVTWRIADSPSSIPDHEAMVDIPQKLPELYSGAHLELWFELDGEHVTARAVVVPPQPKHKNKPAGK